MEAEVAEAEHRGLADHLHSMCSELVVVAALLEEAEAAQAEVVEEVVAVEAKEQRLHEVAKELLEEAVVLLLLQASPPPSLHRGLLDQGLSNLRSCTGTLPPPQDIPTFRLPSAPLSPRTDLPRQSKA